MPTEETAPQPAAPVAAPAPAPVEAAEPAAQPVGQQRSESFDQTMRRLGGYSAPPSTTEEPAPPVAEAQPEPVKPEPKPEKGKRGKAAKAAAAQAAAEPASAPAATAEPAPEADEMAQLTALAKKLGLEIDTGKVTAAERIRLREERRARENKLAEQERAVALKLEQAAQQFGQELTDAREVKRVLSSLDPDAIAKVAGYESYDKFQEAMLAKATDPNYLRIRELERRDAERQAAEAKRQEEQARLMAQQTQAQREQTYLGELTTMMQASKNPVVAALADDPRFARTVMQIQREHYDPVTKTTLTAEQAIKVGVRGAQRALEEEMRQMHTRLSKAFGGVAPVAQTQPAAPAAPPPDTDKPGAKPRPKTQVAPSTPEAAPSKRRSKTEWAKYESDRLREAIAADLEAEYREKSRKTG